LYTVGLYIRRKMAILDLQQQGPTRNVRNFKRFGPIGKTDLYVFQ